MPDVEIAEPVYKKRLHNDFNINSGQEFVISNKNTAGRTEGWIPDDELFEQQWHYHNTGQDTPHGSGTPGCDIDLIKAWDIETGHPDVRIAIIDAGIQLDHEDLQGNISGPHMSFVEGYGIKRHAHGTHVAGTVAAVSNNEIGVAGAAGGSGNNNGAGLMSCQIFVETSMGTIYEGADVAPVWAADNGAAISQNSWGYIQSGVYEQPVLYAIDYFNENGGGEVLTGGITIFAAGNADDNGDWYPAYYEGAMAVAATNNKDQKASFSNYGYWIDISAPGKDVFSTISSTYVDDDPPEEIDPGLPTLPWDNIYSPNSNLSYPIEHQKSYRHQDNSYAYGSGTSMSAPHVSGVAALVISFAHRNGITLSNTDVWNILVNSAECIDHLNPGYEGKLGSGRLNAYYALDYVLCQPKYFENQIVQSDKTVNYCHTVLRNVVVSSATLTINSDKAVIEDNVTVQDGAKLIINADNVIIDKNFEVELGSDLVINPN